MMKKSNFILSMILTALISQSAVAIENENDSPTLSYQIIDDVDNIAVNVFAFMNKPMYVSYRDDIHCSYKDDSPQYKLDDVDTSGLKEIDIAENQPYQLTVHPIKKVGNSIETLLIFMIPEKNQNSIHKIDENCSIELGEKKFVKYTLIERLKMNETSKVNVGNRSIEIKLIPLETPKEIL